MADPRDDATWAQLNPVADTQNPYRFNVEVEPGISHPDYWYAEVTEQMGCDAYESRAFPTEAEANKHAELIRQAMREVS